MYFFKISSFFDFLLIINCVCFVSVKTDIIRKKGLYSNQRISSVEVPGSEPITIFEGDSIWDQKMLHSPFNAYTTMSSTNIYNPLILDNEEEEKYAHSALKQFLDRYAEKIRREKFQNATRKTAALSTNENDESINKNNWSLMDSRKHNHPFEDKEGWVSLEPIPWSISQISKWKNKPKPEYTYNTQVEDVPVESNVDFTTVASVPSSTLQNYKYKPLSVTLSDFQVYPNENSYDRIKNRYKKPIIQKPVTEDHFSVNFGSPLKQNVVIDNDIITDGLSPNFPKKNLDYNRRQGTELYPETHPFTGNGNWVLLSTSKGFKYPKKQRAIKLQPQEVNEHKSVQLTVLPPLKDSKINMTTSHGGLLQVESTFEPVEQTQKKFEKMQKLKNKRRRPINLKNKKKLEKLKSVNQPLARSTGDSSAVLAGVGAGLIPATMAMFVPLVMRGNKRKKRYLSE